MGQPKRKHSKARSRKRRGAQSPKLPHLSKDSLDQTACLAHRVNPANGMYRGRQVMDIKA